VILDAGRFVALVRMSEVAIHNSPGNAGNPEIADNAGNGKRQTPSGFLSPPKSVRHFFYQSPITNHRISHAGGIRTHDFLNWDAKNLRGPVPILGFSKALLLGFSSFQIFMIDCESKSSITSTASGMQLLSAARSS
jgi:hypothetical protein